MIHLNSHMGRRTQHGMQFTFRTTFKCLKNLPNPLANFVEVNRSNGVNGEGVIAVPGS